MTSSNGDTSGFFSGIFDGPATLMRTAVLFGAIFTILVLRLPFYGDQTTLVSAPALYYYETGFSTLLLPESLTTGHPPLYPIWIALLWTIFGKSLAVVHIWSLLCLLFLCTQLLKAARHLLNAREQAYMMLFVLCYPVLWAQTAGMSAELLLTGLFVWALRSVVEHKQVTLAALLSVMPLLSLRGWVLVAAVGLFALFSTQNLPAALRVYWKVFLAAIVPGTIYFVFQYVQSGWWLLPPHGNWAAHRSFVDARLLGGKVFEFTLRSVEFGMLIPLIMCTGAIWRSIKGFRSDQAGRMLLCTVFALMVFTLPFRNPILIRYFMPVHLLILILYSRTLSHISQPIIRRLLIATTIMLMVAHHFFAYPQMRRSLFEYSWGDGSLAHLAFFTFRHEARDYLDEAGVPRDSVYTSFPAYKSFHVTDLNHDTMTYSILDVDRIPEQPWILYANNMNMVSKDSELLIEKSYTIERRWYAYPVECIVYKRKPRVLEDDF